MIYSYEKACKEAGLSEETTAEIRKMFDTDYKRLKREKNAREKSGIGFFTVEQLAEATGDDGDCGFDIPDPTNLEEMVIHAQDMERLQHALEQMPDEDRKFLLVVFSGEHGAQTDLAAELGMTLSALKYRKGQLLKQLREIFFEKD